MITNACFETLGLKLRKSTLDYYAKNKTIHQHRQNPHGLHQPTNRVQTFQRRKPRNRICRLPTKTKRKQKQMIASLMKGRRLNCLFIQRVNHWHNQNTNTKFY